MLTLRPYQKAVISKIMWAKDLPGNDVICVAQGGGKSVIIAELARRLGKPVLVICPNKEILEQNIEKMGKVMDKHKIGVYSASMNQKKIGEVTLGTVQSMYKTPHLFEQFDICIIDECDLLDPKNLKTMFHKLLKGAKITKVFGFTGTPFRQAVRYERWGNQKWMVNSITTTKMITRIAPIFWNRMLTVVNTHELLEQDYLSSIEYHDVSLIDHENIPTNKSKSEFDLEKFEKMIDDKEQWIANFISGLEHQSKLVFCASITQANDLQTLIPNSAVVTSETSKKERERIIRELKLGQISVVLNVGIFTVGFDYPELDCIVLLRPTRSLRLHCQILGRVSRKAEGKKCGHVYDLVSNVKNLGELSEIKIEKVDGKWNVTGGLHPHGFHDQALYSYKLKKPNQFEKGTHEEI